MECYKPSSLITNIHRDVPFLTDAKPGNQSVELVLHLGDDTKEYYDYFVVSEQR